jgi:hypothetical protein
MMATRRPKNVVAKTANGDITTEMILGFIALVSIPNKPVSATKLRRLWMIEGLEEKLVPKQRRSVDVFMAACRSIESRRSDAAERVHEIKVDRVLESSEECVYQITQLVRDKDHRVIDHPKAMRLTFTPKDGKITDEALDDKALYKELKQLATIVRDDFDRNSSKVPGSKVRAAIRATLADQHATRIQNKGVFFVPKAARTTLDAIQNVLDGLYSGGDHAEMGIIPLASDQNEKDLVKRHFEGNVTSEVDALLAECSQRLKSDVPVRGDRKSNLVAERKRIGLAVERYQDLLDGKLDVLQEGLRLLDNSLEELLLSG